MEITRDTLLYRSGDDEPIGKAKLIELSPEYSNTGLRELKGFFSLELPTLVQPGPPKTAPSQFLELQVSNFIYGIQCNVIFSSGKITTLRALGGHYFDGIVLRGEMTDEMIQFIENTRQGSDVVVRLFVEILLEQRTWWHVKQGTEIKNQSSWVSYQGTLMAFWDNVKIAASDWTTEFLPGFKYDSPFYLEMPRLPSDLTYGSARQHMENALNSLKAGGASYRAVPTYCLNALDALAKSFGYDNFSNIPELSPDSNVPERKAVIQKFKNYVNRWRHDQTAKGSNVENLPLIDYEEAMFIYMTTSYLIQLVAKLTPQKAEQSVH